MPCNIATDQEQTKSTHKVEIVPVELEKHPNADTLSVVKVFGYTCVAKTSDWANVKKAAWVPPDNLVDVTRKEFSFLVDKANAEGKYRVKAVRLRQVLSYGLLVPAPDDAVLGDDWAERLGVTHYEPEIQGEQKGGWFSGGEVAASPGVHAVKYDVDSFQRYHGLFEAGEPVVLTEKLDGANSRYVWSDGKMNAGSRTEWKRPLADYSHITVEALLENAKKHGKEMSPEDAKDAVDRQHAKPKKKNLWWEVLERTPALERFCRDNPDTVVYGEVFGNVNCIKYGLAEGNRFAAFDLMKDGRWLNFHEAYGLADKANLDWAPVLNGVDRSASGGFERIRSFPYDFTMVVEMAEGISLVPNCKQGTIREGIVVRPLKERYDQHVGRVCFKVVSGKFLEKHR